MKNASWNRIAHRAILLLGMLLVCGSAMPMLAQFTTARLSGTVLDPSGLGLAGAKVTVKDELTAYTRDTMTNSSGEYLFTSLPVGTYQIAVTMTGFTSYVQNGIALQVDQSVNLPVHLKLGAVSERVTVTADASMVTTDSATLEQVINQKDLVDLPLNTRYTQQLVFLVPGAQNATSNYCAANCEGGVFPSEQYAKVNGAGANGVSYQLGGSDFNDTYINTNLPFPNPDAIQEFSLVTGNMSAVYGNALGGVVNVTLKSGTNSIHGDVFEFLRNSALDAANYFSITGVSPLKQNQFGGDVGGPLLKNRLFFFGSYQGTRYNQTNAGQIAFVPDAAERQGDFSELMSGPSSIQLLNPYTGANFTNNQIPVNPVATYILHGVPLPNPTPGQPSNAFNFSSLPTRQNTNEYLAKLDYNFRKHHLSGHYFRQSYTQPLVIPTTDYLQMTGSAETLVDHNVSVDDTYTISPHFLLASYYGHTKIDGTTYASNPFTMVDAGVKNYAVPPTHSRGAIASVNIGAGGFGISGGVYGVWNRGNQSLREIATLIRGKHVLQLGGEMVRLTQPMGNTFQEGGTFDFGSATGYNLADFEYGYVTSFIQGGGLYLNFTGINWSAFVNDDWKVTRRLTLSAGLRWDPYIPSKDSLGRVACLELGTTQPSVRYPNAPLGLLYGGSNHDPGCPEAGIFNNLSNFGPRFGFAYQATKDGKTSIRGGAGYYYEPPNSLIYQQIVGVPPFAPIYNLNGVSLSDPYGTANPPVPDPFPAGFGPRNPPSSVTFSPPYSFSQIQDPHLRLPMILGWNLTVEHGFGSNWMLRVAYVGNEGRRLYGTGDQESGLLQLNPEIQGQRLYPNFGSVASINSGVNSNYNALQLTAEKRLGHGLSLLSSFAWAKALDDYAPQPQGSLNFLFTNSCTCGRHFDYGPSADDLNKVFKINGAYAIPHVHAPRIVDKLLNGWQLTAIADWQTGLPFTIYSGVDNSQSAIGNDRADLMNVSNIGQAVLAGRSHRQSIQEWFNVNDFTVNAAGTFGNTPKNGLRGPRFFNTDLAIIKNTHVGERVSVAFRSEFFNAFNNVNFGLPGNQVAAGVSSGFGQIFGTAGSGAYGGPTSYGTAQPRIIQFGLKVSF